MSRSRFGPLSPSLAMALLGLLILAASPPGFADSPDLTEFMQPYPQSLACAGFSIGVYADIDANGVNETLVVFHTLANSEAYGLATSNHLGSAGYFYSGANAHCGGSPPYQTGRCVIWFVDMLAPGFVLNDPNSWTYKSVPGVDLVTSSDVNLVGGQSSGYRQVRAYTQRNAAGTVVGSYQASSSDPWPGPLADQTCSFSHAQGVSEIALRTDFAENTIWSLVVRSAACSGPVITEQPQNRSVCLGDAATFIVNGTASDPITYQWFRNDTAIPGATASTLTVNPVTWESCGEYRCTLTTPCGSATSNAALLAPGCATVVWRVNAGGPQVAPGNGGPNWSADTGGAPSPYVNATATGNATGATAAVIDVSDTSIPAGTPMALFQDERWDPTGGAELQWRFPVSAGYYMVRLYFAEIYTAITAPGLRTFDVSLNGQSVLANFDMFARAGQNKGFVKHFNLGVAAPDTFITIDFTHRVENPAVKAIEIIRSCGAARIDVQPQSPTVCVGEAAVFSVAAAGGPPLTYQWYESYNGVTTALPGATGTHLYVATDATSSARSYWVTVTSPCGSVVSNVAGIALAYPPTIHTQPQSVSACLGGSAILSVAAGSGAPPPAPPTTLNYQWYKDEAVIPGATSSSYTVYPVTGAAMGSYHVVVSAGSCSTRSANALLDVRCQDIVYRVNAGGPARPATDAGPGWSADTAAEPSPYVNAAATGNATGAVSAAISMGDPSVPVGTPMAIMQDERWDPPGGAELQWRFPVASGHTYVVRLYFAEIYTAIVAPGMRTYDVAINGQTALPSFDVYLEAGQSQNRAIMRHFNVDVAFPADAITLDFSHRMQNPQIQAIEVALVRDGLTSSPLPEPASAYLLEQNVPNPFNPRTTIAFELPSPGHATLSVFDLAGRLVRTLADADLPAGRHRLDWDGRDAHGRNVAAGIFVYRLRCGDVVQTKRMTLMK